jgi:hypothetical protein
MSKSYRIRTQVGVDRQVNVQLDQDFDQIEILSLKIRSEDVYTRMCADYGVVVGRVFTNGGYGVPNAKLSIFIPIDDEDLNNEVIRELYPYESIEDTNEDGYRYNLLPYEKSHGGHVPTGTFPSRNDVLTNPALIQVYDKYYKFTVKTNGSGDFMIMGVPIGTQTLVMNLDLSDIGPFSMSPQDLVRMGRASQSDFNTADFNSSVDFQSLPQIVTLNQSINVQPFWGQPELCEVGIVRYDFNLGDVGVSIEPTSMFMGSLTTNIDDKAIANGCRPPSEMGNLCNLTTSSGEIVAIRQTIFQDSNGLPILEQAELPNGGKVIDEEGTWLLEVPMNLDYVTTNEFGEQILSNDPKVGVPTKGKYRFKVKYGQSPSLELSETRRAYFLVPNVKEYGWSNSVTDPYYSLNTNSQNYKDLLGSYYFGLDWSGYTNPQAAVNCEDTFYEFAYNKVYTVSGLIDQYFKGLNRGNFIGIKEITDSQCASENNKYPATDGVRNFDLLFFIVNILLTILSPLAIVLIPVLHFVAQFWPIFRTIIKFVFPTYWNISAVIMIVTALGSGGIAWGLLGQAVFNFALAAAWNALVSPLLDNFTLKELKLPMLSYPDCEACDCEIKDLNLNYPGFDVAYGGVPNRNVGPYVIQYRNSDSLLIQSNSSTTWGDLTGDPSNTDPQGIDSSLYPSGTQTERDEKYQSDIAGFQYALGGYPSGPSVGMSVVTVPSQNITNPGLLQANIILSQSMNLANIRERYFEDSNVIQTTVSNTSLISDSVTDNVMVLLMQPGTLIPEGTLMSFVDPTTITDLNLSSTTQNQFGNYSITGTSQTGVISKTITYIQTNGLPATANLYITGSTSDSYYKRATGVEYFQVLTGMTALDVENTLSPSGSLLRKYFIDKTQYIGYRDSAGNSRNVTLNSLKSIGDNWENYVFYFVVRGVDPYTEKQNIKYDLSKLFGYALGSNSVSVEGSYYLNIPIQPNSGSGSWRTNGKTPESHQTPYSSSPLYHVPFNFSVSQQDFQSVTTNSISYYSSLDKDQFGFTPHPGYYPLQNFLNSVYTVGSGPSMSDDGSINQGVRFQGIGPSALYQGVIEGGSLAAGQSIRYSLYSPKYSSSLNVTISYSNILSNPKLVLRSDRLPTSDVLNNSGLNSFSLYLNPNFAIYLLDDSQQGQPIVLPGGFGLGQQVEGQGLDNTFDRVISSFSCSGMVPLACYGKDSNGGLIIKTPCPANENPVRVQDGCYDLLSPDDRGSYIRTIRPAIQNYFEWLQRFRLTFAFCRGVFSHIFVNSWINGNLYAFPFKNKPSFDSNNRLQVRQITGVAPFQQVKYSFCADTIVFDPNSNNFYYRSSPWDEINSRFIGKASPTSTAGGIIPGIQIDPLNQYNLLYPTTIMDLGPKYIWSKDVILSPNYYGYQMDNLNSTSWNEIDNLSQIFIISRLVNVTFLQQVLSSGQAALSEFFTRDGQRIDGDYAQMLQINSQYGISPFNEGNYVDDPSVPGDNPIYISTTNNGSSVFGLFYNSYPESRDLISPRRIDRNNTGSVLIADYLEVKSQEVPFYQWRNNAYTPLGASSEPSIFGNDRNTWYSVISGFRGLNILSKKYQELDRLNTPFFIGNNGQIENKVGYIFQRNPAGEYEPQNSGGYNFTTLNSAPWYFYFGLKTGGSAMDKYRQLYIGGE